MCEFFIKTNFKSQEPSQNKNSAHIYLLSRYPEKMQWRPWSTKNKPSLRTSDQFSIHRFPVPFPPRAPRVVRHFRARPCTSLPGRLILCPLKTPQVPPFPTPPTRRRMPHPQPRGDWPETFSPQCHARGVPGHMGTNEGRTSPPQGRFSRHPRSGRAHSDPFRPEIREESIQPDGRQRHLFFPPPRGGWKWNRPGPMRSGVVLDGYRGNRCDLFVESVILSFRWIFIKLRIFFFPKAPKVAYFIFLRTKRKAFLKLLLFILYRDIALIKK